jgi:hypothetical protein
MSFWNALFGLPDTVTYTEATNADVAEQRLQAAGTFAGVGENLTGDTPADVTNMTAAEMVEAELALMKGLGL